MSTAISPSPLRKAIIIQAGGGRGDQAGSGGRSNDQASGKCHRYQTV